MNAGLAKNKFHTRLILERNELPNIPYARPQSVEEAEIFINTHGTVIAKPVRGSGAADIHIINSVNQLPSRSIKRYIFEKYITGKEMRYLVLNDQVIAVHECNYGTSVQADRDLERVSLEVSAWDKDLSQLSVKVAEVFGLKFITVDYLVDASGRAYILEINTIPGLKYFHAPTSGPVVDVAGQFLLAMLEDDAETISISN